MDAIMNKVSWYNLNVLHSEKSSTIVEKPNKMGKYAKRKDVEPLINDLFKYQRESTESIKLTENMIKQFRSHFSKESNDVMLEKCDILLKRLREFL